MESETLTVGLVQQRCGNDVKQNLEKSIAGIKDAAGQGAKLVLLQELHTNLYFCQTENMAHFELAETIPGPSSNRLAGITNEYNVVIIASLFEKCANGLFHNTAVVIESGGTLAGKYRKMHIPHDPGYYEKFYFTPGDSPFLPIQTSVGLLGVMVCWDQWYPEAARLMALSGAEILLYPTAIGWDQDDSTEEKSRQQDSWKIIQRSHAIANNLPILSCNRVGFEINETLKDQGIEFWGGSFVAGPQGEILAEAPYNKESVLLTDINLRKTKKLRMIWPFLRDRRIDAYTNLLKRYRDTD